MSTNSQGRWEFDEDGNVHYVAPEPPPKRSSQNTDGSYHYSYTNNYNSASGPKNQPKRTQKSDDGWHWVLIVLGFVIWWPVGLVLLFLQIFGKWPGSQKVERELNRASNAAKNAAKQFSQNQKATAQARADAESAKWQQTMNETRAAQAAQTEKQARKQAKKQEKARKKADRKQSEDGAAYGLGGIKAFRTIGAILAGVFGFAFVMELIDQLTYFIDWNYLLGETVPLLALMLAGLTLVAVGGSRKRKLRLFQKYKTMIGDKTVVPIAALAGAMGKSEKKVEKDLEEMLERGVLGQGYVDAGRRALVLGSPLEDEPEPEPEPETEPADNASATLRRIRGINDAIANPEISDKIDRIEELTAKIFRLLEEKPEKAGELRSFMNYYLPQTLKILESYSKLEAQGIEGENIAEAKTKIEAMMDKLVDGYETQLDKLFADDVLDISADLKVMESMLEKDGLTVDSELHF